MKHKTLIAFTLFALTFTGIAAADQWIHVKVENQHDEELVTVNLPFSMLHAAVAMIPEDARTRGEISIDELDMDWNELMNLWSEIKNAPEATFVTVKTRDENVVVKKDGDFLLVETTERSGHGADVDVKLPLTVVDALLSGPEGTFDFAAAIEALAAYGPGELVTVRDGDETVRVWIDDSNQAD